jgi:hypothetical protein
VVVTTVGGLAAAILVLTAVVGQTAVMEVLTAVASRTTDATAGLEGKAGLRP